MSVYSETPTDEGEKMLNSIANRRRRTRLGQRAHTTKQPDTCIQSRLSLVLRYFQYANTVGESLGHLNSAGDQVDRR